MTVQNKQLQTLIDGWPVYTFVAMFLFGYYQFWFKDQVLQIHDAAAMNPTTQSVQITSAIQANTQAAQNLADGQKRIEGQLTVLTTHLLND